MNILQSNDFTQLFGNIPDWAMKFWKEVHTGPNRAAYTEAEHIGNGKNEPFPGKYNYLHKSECYIDYEACPPVVRYPVRTENCMTFCNYAVATGLGFLGRKDIEKDIAAVDISANKLPGYLRQCRRVKELYLPITYFSNHGILLNNNSCIVGVYVNPHGHGHTSIIIGYGTDRRLYCINKGSKNRDGIRIVDGLNSESAFYARMEDILFFEIRV